MGRFCIYQQSQCFVRFGYQHTFSYNCGSTSIVYFPTKVHHAYLHFAIHFQFHFNNTILLLVPQPCQLPIFLRVSTNCMPIRYFMCILHFFCKLYSLLMCKVDCCHCFCFYSCQIVTSRFLQYNYGVPAHCMLW